jgi:hypothetical protein
MTFREREDTEIWTSKRFTTSCLELALEEAVDLLWDENERIRWCVNTIIISYIVICCIPKSLY